MVKNNVSKIMFQNNVRYNRLIQGDIQICRAGEGRGGRSRIGDGSATFRQRQPPREQLLDRDIGAAVQLLRRQRHRQRPQPEHPLHAAVTAHLPLRRTSTSSPRCNSQLETSLIISIVHPWRIFGGPSNSFLPHQESLAKVEW